MTNEEILQKLEEEIHLLGFSPHTQEEYMIRPLDTLFLKSEVQ
ncbi:MAG: hypothetical protein WCD89_23485 [Anaerocolumna sp.]